MSDREAILRALREIQRRFRLNRTLHQSAILLGMAALGALLWRLLHVFGGRAPAASALVVLASLLLWALGAALLLRSRLQVRFSLSAAAAAADQRAGLKDEVQTAVWFIERDGWDLDRLAVSPWVGAQITRAAGSVRGLDLAALLPIRLAPRALAGGVAALLLLALAWLMPPLLAPGDALALRGPELPDAQARQAQLLRDLIAQTTDPVTADKLEQAMKSLERKDASDEEKRRALAAAEQAVEQQNLQAASTREGLYRVSDRLQGNRAMDQVAEALQEGDAKKAAGLLQQMTGGVSGGASPSQMPDPHANEKDLERLLQAAGKSGEADQHEAASVAAREAIDRLKQIAEQLESQAQLARAAQSLQQLQLAVAQRSQMSAGRFSQEAAQDSAASPNTGETVMPGGRMFRSAAVAQESKPSAQQEGSKSGNAMGESEAEPVLGGKTTPLAVQLKREGVAGERQDETGQEGRDWFYTQSKEQRSVLELNDVQARARFAQADTAGGEGISMRHRRIVKDYFINLREGAK